MTVDATYETHRPLKSAEKVAALLLVMGKPLASRLLGHFDPAELKLITRSAAQLGSVPIDVLEDLVEEFAGEFSNGMEVLGSSNSGLWDKIATVPPPVLGEYLGRQHPQVLALALSRLPPATAAAIMEVLPRENRNEATRRLLSLGAVADAALRVIETQVHQDLIIQPPAPAGAATAKIANIINKMAPEHVEDMLKALQVERPDEAEALRAKLFAFDDLATLPPKTKQALFEKVSSDRIVVALSSADAAFRANVLSSLTARARRLVENELAGAGELPAKEVATARRAIVDTLLDMADRGEVELRIES